MSNWLTDPVTLPRWVVWGCLLTSPALWSGYAKRWLKRKFPEEPPKEGRSRNEST